MRSDLDTFSVCFNMVKIKYVDFDNTFDHSQKINPGDGVNVFLNFEMVLKNISSMKDLERKVFDCHNFPTIMISNMINLIAHYRRFFRGNGLDTRVYLYYTDFTSDLFNESSYNEDYRTYYINKYHTNPRYVLMGEILEKEVFPIVKSITDFLGGIYFIQAKNIEGCLVPQIIANMDKSRKNVVITSDALETQYGMKNQDSCYLLKRNNEGLRSYFTQKGYLEYLVHKTSDSYETELSYYSNPSFYLLLLACMGDKYRNLESVPNLKNSTLIKLLEKGIQEKKITKNTKQFASLKEIFPEIFLPAIESNFHCVNFEEMGKNLTKEQIHSITSQLVDRFDHNSLLQLNSTQFFEYPMMLEALTM